MNPVSKQRHHRKHAQHARQRFEQRFTRVRRGIDDVAARGRATMQARAPELLPWVFSFGLIFGLRRPFSLRSLFRGALRIEQMSHGLTATASAVAHSKTGQEAMAFVERMIHPEEEAADAPAAEQEDMSGPYAASPADGGARYH